MLRQETNLIKNSTNLIRRVGYQILSNKKDTKHFNLDEFQIQEYIRCKNNPLFYIKNYVKFEITGGISSYNEGTNFHNKLKRFVRSTYRYHNAELMASRQLGKSTISAGIISWAVTFFPRNTAIILNLKKDAALGNLKKIKFINESLPEFMRLDVSSKSEIKSYVNYSNGSEVKVFYPSSVHAKSTIARSLTSPILYIDEAAHIPHMKEIFGSSQQILSNAREQAKKNNYPYFIIITTTPNGIEGDGYWFYDRWNNGIDSDILFVPNGNNEKWIETSDVFVKEPSKNGFIKVRYHWSEDPTKDQNWYIEQCRELSDQRMINQELDLKFVGSSNCIFDDDLLGKFKAVSPIDYVDCPFETKLKIFEKDLNPNDYYIIGVDTSRAVSKNSAFDSIEVFSFVNFNQVAEFNYRLGSFSRYSQIIDFIFRWLFKQVKHNIILAIENNTIGLAPIENLLEIRDINYHDYIYKEERAREFGVTTSSTSKDLMIGCLTEILRENPTCIKSQELINQLSAVERRSTTISSDTFSDLFMSSCFCAYVRKMRAIEIMPIIKVGYEQSQKQKYETISSFINLNVDNFENVKSDDKATIYSDREIDKLMEIELRRQNNVYNKGEILDDFISPFL